MPKPSRFNTNRWRGRIAAQEKSGLTVREFAQSRGITPTTLYWRRNELKRRATRLVPVALLEHDITPIGVVASAPTSSWTWMAS